MQNLETITKIDTISKNNTETKSQVCQELELKNENNEKNIEINTDPQPPNKKTSIFSENIKKYNNLPRNIISVEKLDTPRNGVLKNKRKCEEIDCCENTNLKRRLEINTTELSLNINELINIKNTKSTLEGIKELKKIGASSETIEEINKELLNLKLMRNTEKIKNQNDELFNSFCEKVDRFTQSELKDDINYYVAAVENLERELQLKQKKLKYLKIYEKKDELWNLKKYVEDYLNLVQLLTP